jgi:hypothetical protein
VQHQVAEGEDDWAGERIDTAVACEKSVRAGAHIVVGKRAGVVYLSKSGGGIWHAGWSAVGNVKLKTAVWAGRWARMSFITLLTNLSFRSNNNHLTKDTTIFVIEHLSCFLTL